MRHLLGLRLLLALMCATACMAMAQTPYADTKAKGDRFFDNREWASAAAMYNFMLTEQPSVPETYGRAIVATEMLGDSLRAMQLLNQAMAYSVPLDSVLTSVRKHSFAVGDGALYEQFMLSASRQHTWMERPLDAYLLRYYTFRRNGPQMCAYAQKMLKGAPENAHFLLILAEGYMIDNQPAKAVATWQRVLAKDPDNYLAIINLANYYDISENRDLALSYFEHAMRLRPTPYVAEAIQRLKTH